MIDIHSHILPGVDDGSDSLETSIEMAKIYLNNGVNKVIATPHYIEGSMDSSLDDNQIALERLRNELNKRSIDLQVFLGNEIYVSMDIMEDISKGIVSTLNNTRYLLLEFSMYDIPLYIESLLYEMQLQGITPIIAHPERNAKIVEDPNVLYKFIDKGALAQLNIPSIEGKYGRKIKNTADILLKHEMIHFIGSDAHGSKNRTPNIGEGLKVLKSLINEEQFNQIVHENGNLLLKDETVPKGNPREYKPKRGIFSFFRGK